MPYDKTSAGGYKKIQFCQYCGTKFDVDARFCKGCGEPIGNNAGASQNRGYVPPQDIPRGNPNQRKTVYEGNLHKCPNCGEVLRSFQATCPACGHEIRSATGSSAVQELALKLEQISAQKRPVDTGRKSVFKMLLESDADARFEDQKKREKVSLITNFSVPNTKEDLVEFMILAASNIDSTSEENDDVSKAWKSKMEQVYQKAELTLKNTPELIKIKELYRGKQRVMNFSTSFLVFFGAFIVLIAIPIMLLGDAWTSSIGMLVLAMGMLFVVLGVASKNR